MNKLLKTLIIVSASAMALNSFAGFGYFGTDGGFVILNSKGVGNIYYHFQDGSSNSSFQGINFGSFDTGLSETFVLNGGEIQTFENTSDDVLV